MKNFMQKLNEFKTRETERKNNFVKSAHALSSVCDENKKAFIDFICRIITEEVSISQCNITIGKFENNSCMQSAMKSELKNMRLICDDVDEGLIITLESIVSDCPIISCSFSLNEISNVYSNITHLDDKIYAEFKFSGCNGFDYWLNLCGKEDLNGNPINMI